MNVVIRQTKQELGNAAAEAGAECIRQAISACDRANVILATGASQFEMLESLVRADGLDWAKVTAFHLDEYVAMEATHPASFRRYLRERFVEELPGPLDQFHYINGEGDPQAECRRMGQIIRRHPIDVAFVGIGENGHLAFNDPPANFETDEPYLVVSLDQACRRQQLGEGWFKTLEDVPTQAISMSIRQIMASKVIICSVPEQRKAEAVRTALEGPTTPQVPASILNEHENCHLFLDKASASMLAERQ